MFFRVNGHFLSKTNGSGAKKFISSQKPTVLGQKSPFPLRNQRFLGKKLHFLSKTNGSGTKKFISSQKPTVLGQKSLFPLKNRRFLDRKVHFLSKTNDSGGKEGKRDEGLVRFEKERNTFSKNYQIS